VTDYSIYQVQTGPGSASVDSAVTLGTEFYVTSTAYAKALRFWRADTTITGAIVGQVYDVSSGTAVSGTSVTFTVSGTGWLTATMTAPVSLTVNARYRAAVFFPSNYSATGGYWSTGAGGSGITNGPLSAPSSGGGPTQSSTQGSFTYGGAIAFPSGTFGSGGYWVDVIVTDSISSVVGRQLVVPQAIRRASTY
jgi:hypothetical protein